MTDLQYLEQRSQMSNRHHQREFHILKFFSLGLIFVFLCLPFTADALPELTGRIAYSVRGFNEVEGKFDYNLQMTSFVDGDYKSRALNHPGYYAVWSPDDDILYFIQRVKTESHIFSIDVNRPRQKTQLTEIGGTYRFLSISPNGKKLAFNGYTSQQQQQENQIWIMDIASGQMEVVTAIPHFGRTFFFYGMSWGPFSKRLVFSLERPGGLEQLFLLDTETLEIEVLTEFNIDIYPVWTPDGKQILFKRWDREIDTMYSIDVETRELTPLYDIDKNAGMWTDWSADSRSIIYSLWGVFYLHDLDVGKTEKLFEVDGGIFGISWWKQEGGNLGNLPVEPKQKITTTWGDVKESLR